MAGGRKLFTRPNDNDRVVGGWCRRSAQKIQVRMDSRIDNIDLALKMRRLRSTARMNLPVDRSVVLLRGDCGPLMYLKGNIDRTGRVVAKRYRAAAAQRAVSGFRRQLSNFNIGPRRQQTHL